MESTANFQIGVLAKALTEEFTSVTSSFNKQK